MDAFFEDQKVLQRLHVGPLCSYIDTFAARLSEQGYARSTAKEQIRLVADLSRWLDRRELELEDLDEHIVDQFLQYRRRRGRAPRHNRATLEILLKQLRSEGVVPARTPHKDDSALLELQRQFAQYLAQERGLSQATLNTYLPIVGRFLFESFGDDALMLDELRPAHITGFIVHHSSTLSACRAKLIVTALRGFLRFLHQRGQTPTDLAAVVPTVAHWRLSTLPKSLEPEQVERVLKGCDQSNSTGQRDYTILLLLARLGLRAGEVVAMRLDDIDWETGILTVWGKGARKNRLPIPHDVGDALVTYLCHGRPCCSTRRVFVRMKAPHREFASSVAICTIVRRALARAGLSPVRKGAHLLRHSLATEMLRKGASLREIGEILRHRDPNTTQVYAKVDLAALRGLAQPWPGGAP